jgi:hypothetical protein
MADPVLIKVASVCVTCSKAPWCGHRIGEPVKEASCEDFEKLKGRPGKAHRGLCVNCDRREGCTLPRPPGGVWHCEEYE